MDLVDRAAVEKRLFASFAAHKAAGDPQTPAKLEARLRDLTSALEEACPPRKHHFALSIKSWPESSVVSVATPPRVQ